MPECSCRGGNPNCFKCGGWGRIGDDIGKHRGGLYSDSLLLKKNRKADFAKHRRGLTNFPIRKTSSEKRYPRNEHLLDAKYPSSNRSLKSKNKRCPYCRLLIVISRLKKHIQDNHNIADAVVKKHGKNVRDFKKKQRRNKRLRQKANKLQRARSKKKRGTFAN